MSEGPASGTRVPAPTAHEPTASAEFARLLEIMRLLRGPGGCPWDREQDWRTLAPYVLEEAHEVVDAIERNDAEGLREEIGDLVFEGVFLSQVAHDTGTFTMADALRTVSEKLIRRHPHVFLQTDTIAGTDGDGVSTPGAVIQQWEEIKARERAAAGKSPESVLDGLPRSLPALTHAHALGKRAARVGFDWPGPGAVLDKVEEEIGELRAEVERSNADAIAEEFGDLLFALAQFARKTGIDPEAAVRAANRKFSARFRALEQTVAREGHDITSLSLEALESIWQRVKDASTG
jgi:MazG family protein